jgi:hypothetical protein
MALVIQDDRIVYISRGHDAGGVYAAGSTVDRKLSTASGSAGYARAMSMGVKGGNGGEITGNEHATQMELMRTYQQGTIGWSRLHPDDIAIGLTHVLGAPTTTDLTGDYLHIWTVGNDASRTVGTFEVQELVADSSQQKLAGCVAQSFTITKDLLSPATASMPYIAKSTAAGSDTPAAISGEPLWLDEAVNVWIGPSVASAYAGITTQNATHLTATPTAYQSTARNFSIGIDNGVTPDRCFTLSGNTMARGLRGARALPLSLTFEFDSAMEAGLIQKTIASTLQVMDTLAIELEWYSAIEIASGAYYGFKAIYSKCVVGEPTVSGESDDGMQTVTIPFTPLYDEGDYGLGADFGVAHFGVWNATAASVYGATS